MPWRWARAAATASLVESGFEAQSATSAPAAWSVSIRVAVSEVTCRQAPTRGDRVLVDLQDVLPVLQRVAHAARRARQLALLADRDEPGAHLHRHRRPEREAAGLHRRHQVHPPPPPRLAHRLDRLAERLR